MSKKYIYLAQKRQSPCYMEARTMCKPVGCPYTTCKRCLRPAGRTRQCNLDFRIKNNIKN